MDNYVMDNMAGAFMITQFFTAKYKSSCSQKILSEENHVAGKSYRRKIYLQEKPIAENLIAGKSYTRKYIVVGLVLFRPFFAKRQKKFMSKRSPLRQRERSDRGPRREKGHACLEKAKRPGAAEGERSRMPGKSEATEQF